MSKFIISGGGTGGHIFPAVAIANAIKRKAPESDILFVGAEGKMEMEKVPAAGYKIEGLPVRGFKRKLALSNIDVMFRLFQSMNKAKRIIKQFNPDVVIGVGGFASGPLLKQAQKLGVPTLIQEQNSYAGVTNKLLAKNAQKICVAYEHMERFFPADKIIITGNPVRQDLLQDIELKRDEAYHYFGVQGNKKTLLILGGSLGALTINESIRAGLDRLVENRFQVIWQTGKNYFDTAAPLVDKYFEKGVVIKDFITRMDLAYSIADLVISRAGASTVSELGLIHKPVIFVPSPNVAEDHQTKNAMALIEKNAAMMIEDKKAREELIDASIELMNDKFRMNIYQQNIASMGIKNSADTIANEVFKLIN
ncbi:MAG: undecaprenyldiphospho-muramoylpentapeptide beta-N-acetylglucosaminyltransferase [Bacteroidales bacterium]|nr:undecaprenyldiphospho-muramoylpentapeptide beta-N-acetylglucosaminyltransferase [Bacteroidales bacterium]